MLFSRDDGHVSSNIYCHLIFPFMSFVGFICTVHHEVASEMCVYEKIIQG